MNKMKMVCLPLLVTMIATLIISCEECEELDIASNLTKHTYEKTEGPDKNPLKGWNTGWWEDHAHASVGFQYLKWKDFEPTNGTFKFDAVEEVLARPGSKGRHLIIRLYCDWWGIQNDPNNAGPEWLYNQSKVPKLQSDNGKYMTDFNHPNYIKEASEAIKALVNHYKNDPRIYVFQIGMLGYWGEWHTFGYEPSYDFSETATTKVIDAYKSNVGDKKIMGRYPMRNPLKEEIGIGYHNDYFGPVDHSYEFDEAVSSNAKWLQGPIGGELPPDVENNQPFLDKMYTTSSGIDIIANGHYSTMKASDNPCDSNPNSTNCKGFMKMHRKMGYNYQINEVAFPETILQEETLDVHISASNIGVAAMYYNWDIQLALLDENDNPVNTYDLNFDLTKFVAECSTVVESLNNSLDNINTGTYRLGIRIIQPEADTVKDTAWGLDARNTYILFSNKLEVINGYWDDQNVLQGGWSILGSLDVK
ncbi:DUF4832 domain-containing protein [Aquimarina sp. 2201CG14-23]|uniref:DUF4832 domain-containing protein n=1 Tax=Aquimarina mycalae TaxID=3040073 RepID=UPI00247816DF|nr:DUF4832 domain-containing protein [Aquimarina sp. 2201CG14-23]MDH7447188.1 DUF4832 domain-containing protein [Aquimarina sp. 2201CG14-23]